MVHGLVRRAHLPGPHAARGRPRAPVPLHLESLAEPRRVGARPRHRGSAVRAAQDAAAAASVLPAARWGTVHPDRASGGGASRPLVPRDGDRDASRLPGDPRRGPGRRGGRSRGPLGGRRVGPFPPAAGSHERPLGDRAVDDRRGPLAADARAGSGRGSDLRDRWTPRSGGALGIRRARPAGAQGGAVDARHALPAGVGGRTARRLPGPARGRRHPRAPPVRLVLVLGGGLRVRKPPTIRT